MFSLKKSSLNSFCLINFFFFLFFFYNNDNNSKKTTTSTITTTKVKRKVLFIFILFFIHFIFIVFVFIIFFFPSINFSSSFITIILKRFFVSLVYSTVFSHRKNTFPTVTAGSRLLYYFSQCISPYSDSVPNNKIAVKTPSFLLLIFPLPQLQP